MKIIFVLIILVFLSPISAGGANWQLVAENKENKIYIDKESINYTSKNLAKAWFNIMPNMPLKIFENYMTYQIVYEEHNCKEDEFRLLQVTSHYSDGTSEEVISEPSGWIDVLGHTIFKTKHEYLCNGTVFHKKSARNVKISGT
jgi:hypothetical protein